MTVIRIGDCLAVLRTLPDGSVNCCVTSPPYFGLRDYGVAGQIGLEPTPDAFVARLVDVFREVKRVLRDDGTLWLNLGDSYNAGRDGGHAGGKKQASLGRHNGIQRSGANVPGLKPKDLIGIPWRVAFALQADGWWLRSDIIWHKPNPMPESVTDRPTSAHEHVFLLAKSERYFFDAEAVKEPVTTSSVSRLAQDVESQTGSIRANGGAKTNGPMRAVGGSETRNIRNVWTISTKPFKGAHFATFPVDLAERCIKAGTSEYGCCPGCGASWKRVLGAPEKTGGRGAGNGFARPERLSTGGRGDETPWEPTARVTTGWAPSCACPAHVPTPAVVLDPFGGAGTTGLVAGRLARKAVLIELNPEYADMAARRIASDDKQRTAGMEMFE